ncbi:MAG: Holliday junction branch migration protein RuvA [Halanaerobiales bacterium]
MIGSLSGVLKWHSRNKIIIEVSGVGYLLEIYDLFKCPQVGEDIDIFVYTYVREDTLDLYGFQTMTERELFVTLLSVSRIGPKAAMNILSSLPYDEFVKAILSENVAVLKKISGIGPKTAQRLILELQNKIDDLAEKTELSIMDKNMEDLKNKELHEALNNLGYSNKEINHALSNVDMDQDTGLEDKIKKILSYLGKESI